MQAAIAAPAPEPQTRIPRSACAALDRLADLARLVRVVDADGVAVGAEVDHVVAGERLEDRLAEVDAAMVERDGDPHSVALFRIRSETIACDHAAGKVTRSS